MSRRLKGEEKAAREGRVLQEVLGCCRSTGGAAAKAVEKMAATEVDASGERPDLRIATARGAVMGLEHFRVDHLVRNGKKAKSKAAEWSSRLEAERRALLDTTTDGPFPYEAAADIVGKFAAEAMQNSLDAVPDDLSRSLDKALFDAKSGHAPKLAAYRDNLPCENDKAIELGFLIEVHSDFSAFFLNGGRTARKVFPGEPLLSPQTYGLLERAAQQVDWLLLGFYPNTGTKIVKAAVLDCRNGRFPKSCRKQGLRRCELLRCDLPDRNHRVVYEGATLGRTSDEAILSIARESGSIDGFQLASQCLLRTAEALNLQRAGRAFAATAPIQALYETVALASRKHKGRFNAETVSKIICGMPPREALLRYEAFGNGLGYRESV